VRRSGMRHIQEDIKSFLARGGVGAVSVGVDIENTSVEGLKDLLDLESHGSMETFVYHNESASTFHPKIYYLADDVFAQLVVGSFNITEAGLFTNNEAGLLVTGAIGDGEIVAAREALTALRRVADPCVRRLTPEFLEALTAEGYIFSEQVLRARRTIAPGRRGGQRRPPLFGRIRVDPPPLPKGAIRASTVAERPEPAKATPVSAEKVAPARAVTKPPTPQVPHHEATLIARVRKVSVTARATQIQLPMRLEEAFVKGVDAVTNAVTAESHNFVRTYARGAQNTLRVELPEIRNLNDPVVRFQRTADGILYRAFDRESPEGQTIMRALMEGLRADPPTTHLTKPNSPESSTWWRFI